MFRLLFGTPNRRQMLHNGPWDDERFISWYFYFLVDRINHPEVTGKKVFQSE